MTEPRAGDAAADNPGVITHPPFLYIGALVAGLLIGWALPLPLELGTGRWIIAGILIGTALTLVLTCLHTFRRAGTNVQTHRPSTTVVSHGPYRFSRNPIYLGLTLLYAGIAVAADSGWALILLVPLLVTMHYGVIAREERYLEAKFGDAYRAYKARVRRWL